MSSEVTLNLKILSLLTSSVLFCNGCNVGGGFKYEKAHYFPGHFVYYTNLKLGEI